MASAKAILASFLVFLLVTGCGGGGGGDDDSGKSDRTSGSTNPPVADSSSPPLPADEASTEDPATPQAGDTSSPADEPAPEAPALPPNPFGPGGATEEPAQEWTVESLEEQRAVDSWEGISSQTDIVAFQAVSQSDSNQTNVPITFGQVFKRGAVMSDQMLSASMNGQAIPTQVDKKATWADGSLRHAVVSVRVPTLEAGRRPAVALNAVQASARSRRSVMIDQLLASNFDAQVVIRVNGRGYMASARQMLARAAQSGGCGPWSHECKQWLSGPLVSEWLVSGPVAGLSDPGGIGNSLNVAFHVRAYADAGGTITRARVDFVIENAWAYKAAPRNITYDATLTTGEQSYQVSDLTHYDHARWHEVLWWRDEPEVYARLNGEYIQATKAVSNYADVTPTEEFLNSVSTDFPPMENGDQKAYMPGPGAAPGIGPLPRWTSTYIVSTDRRAFAWMLANDDAVGSYGFHYRDAATGRPLDIIEHPYVTIAADSWAHTSRNENWSRDALPRCVGDCSTPYVFDISHHPSIGYVPYMVTGDYYYLEEMQFTASYVELWMNAAYRDYEKGHLVGQVRGQAWALRSISDAAFITPDDDPLKGYYTQLMANNLQKYNSEMTNGPEADNPLHVINTSSAVIYDMNGQDNVGISPWQQDFFNWAIGHAAEQGFEGAKVLLKWLSEFSIGRMTDWKYNDGGFCWLQAAVYKLQVRAGGGAPDYSSLNRAYMETYPDIYALPCNSEEMLEAWGDGNNQAGEMSGYPWSPTGFPSNFQIGLAMAADSGIAHAEEAWEIFAGRSVKPDYSNYPNFAVIPRH